MFYIKPLKLRDEITRNGTFHQFVIIKVIRYYLKDLTNFERCNPAYCLVSNLTWKYFFTTRAFIQAPKSFEFSKFEEVTNPEGVLISTSYGTKQFDLVIVYIPNIPLFCSEPFFYIEYLMTLHGLLLLKGFINPSIFIMKFPEICKESSMENILMIFISSWKKIVKHYKNSKIILMGDSFGATLILNFLSIINEVFYNDLNINIEKDLNLEPFAVILISPIVDFNNDDKKDNKTDYLKYKTIHEVGIFYCSDRRIDKYNPIKWDKLELWDRIIPAGGMVITFGENELQSKELNNLSRIAFETNRLKVVKSKNKCHCWQFISFMSEETQNEKESSCFMFSSIISCMVLYQTKTQNNSKIPL